MTAHLPQNDGPDDDGRLLALAARLADEAASVILQIRARGFETLFKQDDSPVTEADRQAEALILAGLRAGSSIPVIAEEEVAAGRLVEAGEAFWLVDPLDGTREFAAGRDSFTVNIGLVRHGRVITESPRGRSAMAEPHGEDRVLAASEPDTRLRSQAERDLMRALKLAR